MLALWKCKPYPTLDFKGVGNKMVMHDGIFWEKYWIKKCEKVDFLQIRHFFVAEMGKLPVKAGSNREHTAPPKRLVAIGKMQCNKNDQLNKKNLFWHLYCHHCSLALNFLKNVAEVHEMDQLTEINLLDSLWMGLSCIPCKILTIF